MEKKLRIITITAIMTVTLVGGGCKKSVKAEPIIPPKTTTESALPLQGYQIACFGDSIIGNARDDTSVSACIAKQTGAITYNFGFGGCQMAPHKRNWDTCSMYRLSEYLAANDFAAFQQKILSDYSEFPSYFVETAELLKETDFSKMDAIVISYGTNDYRRETSTLDNPDDLFDYHTVIGALRYSVHQIQRTYPKVRILVTTPIYRVFLDENNQIIGNSDTTSFGSGTLEDYSTAMQAACKQMKVVCLDLYHESNFNANTWQYYYDENDGTHPNALGREHIATMIGNKLQTLL